MEPVRIWWNIRWLNIVDVAETSFAACLIPMVAIVLDDRNTYDWLTTVQLTIN